DIHSAAATTFACRPISGGRLEHFLSVFVPYQAGRNPDEIAARVGTSLTGTGSALATIGKTTVAIRSNGAWSVSRQR
ncbi:MAG: hypothetical protein GWO24_08585, partial [Akkermansiaceae bacterium]|nr:hypothetical protein [Akkermansiaceae bacterium]